MYGENAEFKAKYKRKPLRNADRSGFRIILMQIKEVSLIFWNNASDKEEEFFSPF